MPLSIGIVGLPNVGKSTLFQTITKKQVDCSNYPFCTIDPNVGVVAVPDERVDKTAEITKSAKKIYNTIEFVDIAGLIKDSHKGEGLGNKFLAHIRETDAIIYVLRGFLNDKIVNTLAEVNPLYEKDILDSELIQKDLETIGKRIGDLKKPSSVKTSAGKDEKAGKKETIKELEVLLKAQGFLKKSQILFGQKFEAEEEKILGSYQLLTLKPRLYVLNGFAKEIPSVVIESFKKNNWPFLIINLSDELSAADFNKEERAALGLPSESELDLLIKKSYELLDLITFFTILSNETRAWAVKRGKKIPQAGGIIHSDFENYFIKADVINWKDLVETGGMVKAREKGLVRTEGKDYIVRDGDVIEVKHGAK